jgi:MinD-like ATPase involved in chromosome partitioning or flagellar assembly
VREVLPGLALVSGVARAGEDGAPASPAERQLLARRVTALFDAYDAVVVDAGSRLEQILAAAAPAGGPAPQLLVVTSADPIAAAASYALVKVLAQRAPATAVALLVAGADAPTAGAAHATVSGAAEQFLGRTVPLAGAVPDDPSLRRAVLGGMPLQDATDGSPAAEAARAVALRAFDRFTVPPRTAGRPGPSAAPHQPHRASA